MAYPTVSATYGFRPVNLLGVRFSLARPGRWLLRLDMLPISSLGML